MHVSQYKFYFMQKYHPSVEDAYSEQIMPKVVHCIHALAHHLSAQGKAPALADLNGKVHFTGMKKKDILDSDIRLIFLCF
jgi:hypothetical protein